MNDEKNFQLMQMVQKLNKLCEDSTLLETDLKVKNDYIAKKRLLIENRHLKTKLEKMENDIETLKNLMMGRN